MGQTGRSIKRINNGVYNHGPHTLQADTQVLIFHLKYSWVAGKKGLGKFRN